MSGGRKRILSPFNGRKKRKAWNKTREKYMPEERRQNLAETDRRSYYKQEEWLEPFLGNKSAFYDGSESEIVIMMMRNMMKIQKHSLQMFFKIGVLKNFANFRGKHLCWSFFVIKLQPKNRPRHRFFPMKFANFLRTPFFTEHLWWLLLKIINSNNYLRVLAIFATR